MTTTPQSSNTSDGTRTAAHGTVYAWGPAPKRKRHLGLWIGTPVAVALVGVVAASMILIAPGTAVAGVQVGGMTPTAAATAIQKQLNGTTVHLTGDGVDTTLTGSQLGATVDAKSLADAAYTEHPMWNLGAWFSGAKHAVVRVNTSKAEAALHSAAPGLFQAPKNAAVSFDTAKAAYVAQPGVDGTGVDLAVLGSALQKAFASGEAAVPVAAASTPVAPAVTTKAATDMAAKLNDIAKKAGFYVGSERTVPVTPATLASWIHVTTTETGFALTVDTAAVQKAVDALPAAVNRAPQNGTAITDPQGKVLQTEKASLDGRTLGDTSNVAARFARQLADGNGVYTLPVTSTDAQTTKIARNIVVSLSKQTTYLYENGKLVHQYLISSGVPGHDTQPGSYRVMAKVAMQDMGCTTGYTYCTKNVPWVSYFYPNVGFHGTYWHHNFGHVMSHGCVNMPIDVAKFVYDWAPIGTPVVVEN